MSGTVRIAAAAVLSSFGAASAQPAARPPVAEMTPARIETDLDGRAFSARMSVVNRTSEPRRVSLSVAGIGHDLDGQLQYIEPVNLGEAIRLSDDGFVLPAEGKARFTVEGSVPPARTALYAAVIAAFVPLEDGSSGAVTRVASSLYLRGPKPWDERIRIVDAGALPGSRRRRVTLFATVENTGNVHVAPRGRLLLFEGSRPIGRVRLRAGNVLPGYARRLTGVWRPPRNLRGPVGVQAVFVEPEAVGLDKLRFQRGRPSAAGVDVEGLRAEDGPRPVVSFSLTNTGNTRVAPTVTMIAEEDGAEAARRVVAEGLLRPGARRSRRWQPDLDGGHFVVRVRVHAGRQLLDQAVTGLAVRPRPPLAAAAASLAAALLALGLVLWIRSRSAGRPGSEAAPPGV